METIVETPSAEDEQVIVESPETRTGLLQFLAEQAQVLNLGYE